MRTKKARSSWKVRRPPSHDGCADCGSYAPMISRTNQPLWANSRGQPLCTKCACQAWTKAHGGDPALAELALIKARSAREGSIDALVVE